MAATPAAARKEGPIQSAIRARLTAAFAPVHLDIANEFPQSESHFKVFVVSAAFEGVPLVQRHRMVMDAVRAGEADLPVHALSVQAKTPAQWSAGATMHTTPKCGGG